MSTIQSGLYRMNYGGMSLAECWRFTRGPGFLVALFFRFTDKWGHCVWLPASESERPCSAAELSQAARNALAPVIQVATELGFREGRYKRVIRHYNPTICDSGGYQALHEDGRLVFFAGYVHCRVAQNGLVNERVRVSSAVSFLAAGDGSVNVLDHRNFLDGAADSRMIILPNATAAELAGRAGKELRASRRTVQRFANLGQWSEAAKPREEAAWQQRIARGLYRKLSQAEENRILAAHPPPPPE